MQVPLLFIIFIVIALFCFLTKQSWCLSKNIEIDDFINILLKSEKFDDLVDVIAEKAAKKIQYLNNYKAKQFATKKDNASKEIENTTEDTLNESEEQNIYKKEYNIQEVKYRNEYAKLNPQTFIQRDAALPTQKLLLKFKHLTKDVHNSINSDKQITENHTEKHHHSVNSNENNMKYSQKQNINLEQRLKKTNKISKMVTSSEYRNLNIEGEKNKGIEEIKEEKKLRTIFQSGEQIYSAEGQHVREVSDIEREHDEIEKHYLLTANGQPQIINQSKKQDKETDSEDFVSKTKTDINKKRNQQLSEEVGKRTNQEIAKTKHASKYSGDEPNDAVNNDNIDEHKETLESEEKLSRNKEFKLNIPKRLRKEGNKVFTFESSPDYDEYHEKNAKVFKHNY